LFGLGRRHLLGFDLLEGSLQRQGVARQIPPIEKFFEIDISFGNFGAVAFEAVACDEVRERVLELGLKLFVVGENVGAEEQA
jgi:hypothetical protein